MKQHTFQLDEYVIKVNGEQIFKDYRTHVKTSKGDDHIFDVQFHELYSDTGEIIAWIWYGLRYFQAVIDRDSPQRGLRLRKDNIQIGDEDVLQRLFKEDRGTHYFIGEVHAVSRALIPNSQRDYFNENQMRNTFEREIETVDREIAVIIRQLFDKVEGNRKQNDDKAKEAELTQGGRIWRDKVVGAVDKGGNDYRKDAEELWSGFISQIRIASRKSVKRAHEYAEAGMAWDRSDRTNNGDLKSVMHHVADIFP